MDRNDPDFFSQFKKMDERMRILERNSPKQVVPAQTAGQTATVTTSFNNRLSAADTDVQKALDTLDNVAAEVTIGTCQQDIVCYPDSILTGAASKATYSTDIGATIIFKSANTASFVRGSFRVPQNYTTGNITIKYTGRAITAAETNIPEIYYGTYTTGDTITWEYPAVAGPSATLNTTQTDIVVYDIPAANFAAGDLIIFAWRTKSTSNTRQHDIMRTYIEYQGKKIW